MAPKSSKTAKAVRNIFKEVSTLLPNKDKIPMAKAMSVAIGIPAPDCVGLPSSCTLPEIEKAIKYLGKNEIVVMSGFQAEPNLIEDIELNKISVIKKSLGVKVGYTDHIEVTNPLTKSLSAMAVLMDLIYLNKNIYILL